MSSVAPRRSSSRANSPPHSAPPWRATQATGWQPRSRHSPSSRVALEQFAQRRGRRRRAEAVDAQRARVAAAPRAQQHLVRDEALQQPLRPLEEMRAGVHAQGGVQVEHQGLDLQRVERRGADGGRGAGVSVHVRGQLHPAWSL
jgi:hypothetical protein